jgi:hypothetical protein
LRAFLFFSIVLLSFSSFSALALGHGEAVHVCGLAQMPYTDILDLGVLMARIADVV